VWIKCECIYPRAGIYPRGNEFIHGQNRVFSEIKRFLVVLGVVVDKLRCKIIYPQQRKKGVLGYLEPYSTLTKGGNMGISKEAREVAKLFDEISPKQKMAIQSLLVSFLQVRKREETHPLTGGIDDNKT